MIIRSHIPFLIKQLCNMVACFLPKLSDDIRFEMMDAILGGLSFYFLNCSF